MHKKVVLNMCNKITAGSIILGLQAAFWAYSGRGYRVRLPAVYFVVRVQAHLLVLRDVERGLDVSNPLFYASQIHTASCIVSNK